MKPRINITLMIILWVSISVALYIVSNEYISVIAYVFSAIISAILLMLGIIIYLERGTHIIAGYNTMSIAEREEYDFKEISKTTGLLLVILSYVLYFVIISMEINEIIGAISLVIFLSIVITVCVWLAVGKRFKSKKIPE